MNYFDDSAVKLDILKQRAFNGRWAEVPDGVVPLTAADPDFQVAPQIIDAMKEYLDGGYLSYTPKLGFPEFRQAIADGINSRKHEGVRPEWVLPLDSAARGMYVIADAFMEKGDEMIVFDPVDFLFQESCKAAGGVPVRFPARVKADGTGLILDDLEEYITPKTKIIGLCNPHNPWGTLYTKEDLKHILDLANKYGLYIMNDEIWSDIVYPEQPFVSINQIDGDKNRVVSVYGFSKSFGVAGLRIGCVYCNDQAVFDAIVEKSAVMTTAGGICSVSQGAGIACMRYGFERLDAFLVHLRKNRDYALERLAAMEGLSCRKPQATYLLFPDITATGLSSQEFAAFMEREVKLAIVPGTEKFFGPGAEGHIRICFATSHAILKEGLDRLERGMAMLKK